MTGVGQGVLSPDIQEEPQTVMNWTSLKVKTSVLRPTLLKEQKEEPRTGKIHLHQMSDKGCVFRIYKELSKLNSKKTSNEI